ncbi:DAHL domain-containing protein [Thauera mechernichensis]
MTRAAVSRLLRTSTHIRLLVLGLVVLAVVGSLFVQAGAVTTGEHLRYARDLREIRQVDAELNTATIASRLDIGSWQAVEAHSARMRTLIDALHDTPSFLTHEERLRVLDQLDSYARMQQHKQQLVAALQEELARITEPAQARHQRLDELSSALLALASARQGEVLVESYAAGYKSAAARTQAHLVLLLAVALGLGVFLLFDCHPAAQDDAGSSGHQRRAQCHRRSAPQCRG